MMTFIFSAVSVLLVGQVFVVTADSGEFHRRRVRSSSTTTTRAMMAGQPVNNSTSENDSSLSSSSGGNLTNSDGKILVQFYGESECPYCRKFVTDVWPEIWHDGELRSKIEYDMIPWGNAYFATAMCGSGSTEYNSQERACWYEHCITYTQDDYYACFGGKGIYQHGLKEGQVDIYESCVKDIYGIEAAVDFTYCCEGPNMDDGNLKTARELMSHCVAEISIPDSLDVRVVLEECFEFMGHEIEVKNSKQTPVHPGVPYVLVDGEPVEDPLATKQAICDALKSRGNSPSDLPKACSSTSTVA